MRGIMPMDMELGSFKFIWSRKGQLRLWPLGGSKLSSRGSRVVPVSPLSMLLLLQSAACQVFPCALAPVRQPKSNQFGSSL